MTCHGRRRRPSRLRLSGAARPASRDLSATDMRCRRTRTQPGRSGARTADRRRRARSSVRKGFSVRLSNRLSVHCASDHTRGSSCAGRVGGNGAETRAARRGGGTSSSTPARWVVASAAAVVLLEPLRFDSFVSCDAWSCPRRVLSVKISVRACQSVKQQLKSPKYNRIYRLQNYNPR